MVTGIECAALVLGVLPLFVSAADAYSKGAETLWGMVLQSRADEALHDFYCEFYWQIALLHAHMRSIWDTVADGTPVDGNEGSAMPQLSAWKHSRVTKNSLIELLGSDASFRMFETAATSIVKLLGQLLRDHKAYVKSSRKGTITDNEEVMFNRLQEFASDMESEKTKSTFAQRFRFFRETKHRDICLKNLGVWNKRLGKLISESGHQRGRTLMHAKRQSSDRLLSSPFLRSLISSSEPVREVTRDLHGALSRCSACDCPGGHEIRLCLNIEHALEEPGTDIPITFDMLVRVTNVQKQVDSWKEGTVLVKLASCDRQDDESRLRSICESLDICLGGYRVRILMEHMKGQQSLWKLEPKPRRLLFLESEAPVPLNGLLDNYFIMSRAEKCDLGLIVTYSLLLFHDSPWNAMPWDKNKLSFFYKSIDEPDYRKPFLTTRFEKGNNEVGQRGANVFHRNYNILMLGILLIEIFMQAKIERFRTEQERKEARSETEANIDLKVADRVVKKMDDAPHRAAIRSCLELDWFPEGQKVLLEDQDVRKGLYENVIEPLKREQDFAS
ncbi:hypothetical protein FQN54_001870 [Arachnomyces sp. PD_36]|nr:hypothetical protein FQN54_001870 [Arachnomyces sp. PD_36]